MRLTLELTYEKAVELRAAVSAGKLAEFRVISAELVSDPRTSSPITLQSGGIVEAAEASTEQRKLWAKRIVDVLRGGTKIFNASLGNFREAFRHAEALEEALKDQHFASFVARALMDEWKQEDFEFEEAAELLSLAGYLLTNTSEYQDADKLLSRAVAIREKLFGPDDLRVAETLSHFANNLADWRRYRHSLSYFERALRIQVLNRGEHHTAVAQVHNDIGIAYLCLHEYDDARRHFRKMLQIWERTGDVNLAESAMYNFAMLYERGGGRDDEDLRLLREGRKLAKDCFGKESERVLKVNDCLATVLGRLGLEEELKEIRAESSRIRDRLGR